MHCKSLNLQVAPLKFHGVQQPGGPGFGVCILGLLLLLSLQVRGTTPAPLALLDSAHSAYTEGKYPAALDYYEKVLAAGYESPEIFYNLGNTCYKLDRIGKSILYYERAKNLAPYDEDIIFNIKLANQRTLDRIEPAPKLFLEEWWDGLKSMQSERTWGVRSIVFFALFFLFLGVFFTAARSFTKQFGFWLAVTFFALSLITFSISRSRYNDIIEKDSAVILESTVEVKNAPAGSGTRLFLLHEGTVVSASETQGDWVKVEVSSEKVGWVKRSSIEFI